MEWDGWWSIIFCKYNATQDSAEVGTLESVILQGQQCFWKAQLWFIKDTHGKNLIFAWDNAANMRDQMKFGSFLCISFPIIFINTMLWDWNLFCGYALLRNNTVPLILKCPLCYLGGQERSRSRIGNVKSNLWYHLSQRLTYNNGHSKTSTFRVFLSGILVHFLLLNWQRYYMVTAETSISSHQEQTWLL